MSNYWIDRLDEQNTRLQDKSEAELTAIIIKLYKSALLGLKADVRKLYQDIQANNQKGIISISDLYKNDYYYKLVAKLNNELLKLNEKEIEVYEKSFLEMYKKEQEILTQYAPKQFTMGEVSAERPLEVVNQLWTSDGKYWSDRVWGHGQELETRIMNTLTDCVSRGLGVNQVVGYLAEDYKTSVYQAERLIRTELSRIQNQAALDRYIASGVEFYEIIGADDDRTCEVCGQMIGKIYSVMKAIPGVTLPPFHPNGRCGIVPVVIGGH